MRKNKKPKAKKIPDIVNTEMLKIADSYIEELEKKLEEEKQKESQIILLNEKQTEKIDLSQMRAYIVKLSQMTHFSDDDSIEFDRIVILTKREFENEFIFSDLYLYLADDEIDITGQAASAWLLRIGWLPDNIPILCSMYTEKDLIHQMDPVITAEGIQTEKEQILERMYLNMKDKYRKYKNKIEEAEFMAASDREDKEKLQRKFKARHALMDNASQEVFEKEKNENLGWQIGTISGWGLALIILLIVAF
jgi:hypothetical protein